MNMPMPDPNTIAAGFDTVMHAGLGLRIFQAFSRSLPAPKENSTGFYRFVFSFVQNLADNKDRLGETRPADTTKREVSPA